jgi:hypothetical protein
MVITHLTLYGRKVRPDIEEFRPCYPIRVAARSILPALGGVLYYQRKGNEDRRRVV